MTFRASLQEKDEYVKARIAKLFNEVKNKYNDVLTVDDNITFDGKTLKHIIGKLQNTCIVDTDRDMIADAFEIFIGYSLKGSQGQFFTPKNIEIVNPNRHQLIIDPSCGSCGFLVEALKHICGQLEREIDNNESLWEEKRGWYQE